MGIRDFFSKGKKADGPDPIRDLTLSNMKVGWIVDYDMKTWEVTAFSIYDWGEGDSSKEWQLRSGDDLIYLELEADDEDDDWSVNRKIPFGRLGKPVRDHILQHGDPPDEIEVDSETYYLDESAGGHFLKGGAGDGRAMLRWSYENDGGSKYLSLEQWGEEDFESSIGSPAQEYQFDNILPRN